MTASIARQLRFAHYATYDLLSREPSEETWIPTASLLEAGPPALILREDVKLVKDAFVYLFIDSAHLRKRLLGATVASPRPFTLVGIFEIDATGQYFTSSFRTNTFNPLGADSLSIPGEVTGAEPPIYYLVSRTLLPDRTIDKLEAKRPPQIPLVTGFDDAHFALVVDDPGQSPATPEWVAFVVDPITIAENFTKLYFTKADAYLQLTQPFAKQTTEEEDAALERQRKAKVRALKKAVADTVKGMLVHVDDAGLKGKIEAAADVPAMDDFLIDFEADLDDASQLRERAAIDLILWIRSELWLDIDESYRDGLATGALGDDYGRFLPSLSDAFSRLAESDPGVAYMMELLDALDTDGAPDRSIPNIYALSEFVLRGDRAIADATKVPGVVVACGAGFLSTWGAFVNLVHAINLQRLKTGGDLFKVMVDLQNVPSPLETSVLGLTTLRMAIMLNRAFGAQVINVNGPQLFLDFVDSTKPAGSVTRVFALDVHYNLVNQGEAVLAAGGPVTHAALTQVVGILNLGLASMTLTESLLKNGTNREIAFNLVDLTQSALEVLGSRESFIAFWRRLNGLDASGAPLLTTRVVAGHFGLIGSVLSLASATNRAIKDYQERDFDAMTGNATQGVGAVLSGLGFVFFIKGGLTGPLAGWFFFAGSVLSIGGYIFTAFADDEDIETLVKNCAFGKFANNRATVAPKWALTPNDDFVAWDPETELGLMRQLDAFQNVFFAFVLSAGDSNDVIRFVPSGLRKNAKINLAITARYGSDLPNSVPADDVRREGHQRTSLIQVDPAAFTMVVLGGALLVTEGQVTAGRVGNQPTIDIRIKPANDDTDSDKVIANPTLRRLRVELTLDVFGDGSRLIPSDKSGGASPLKMVIFDAAKVPQERPQSSTAFHS
jgi:hypothetical protein